MAITVRAKRREQEYEIVCHGVDRETFLGIYHDIVNLKPEPRVAIRNPDPLTFAADAVHSFRAIFGNPTVKMAAGYVVGKAVEIIVDVIKDRLKRAPQQAHIPRVELFGPDGKVIVKGKRK